MSLIPRKLPQICPQPPLGAGQISPSLERGVKSGAGPKGETEGPYPSRVALLSPSDFSLLGPFILSHSENALVLTTDDSPGW